MKNITLITLFVGALAFITSAYASVSGNLTVTSDYFWRGTTQTEGEAAIQGGLDYAGEGYYAGAWVSGFGDASSTSELDLYIGTDFKGFDVGIIKYFIDSEESTEYYVGYSISGFDLSYAVDVDDSDLDFFSASYGFGITEGLDGTITYGDYEVSGDYLQLDVAYGDLTLSVIDHDTAEDLAYVISYGWAL